MNGEHPVEIGRRQVDEQGLVHDAGVVDEMGGVAKGRRAPPRPWTRRRASLETSPAAAIAFRPPALISAATACAASGAGR